MPPAPDPSGCVRQDLARDAAAEQAQGGRQAADRMRERRRSPRAAGQPSRIAALLSVGLILPILDGLDEIPGEVRGPAIARINDSLRPANT